MGLVGTRGARHVRLAFLGLCLATAAPGIGVPGAAGPERRSAGWLLSRARALEQSGDRVAAQAALAEVAARHPVVADFADLQQMRLALAGGELAVAREVGSRWAAARTPLAAEFEALSADLALAEGDADAAIRALERARSQSANADQRAGYLLRIGELQEAARRSEAAAGAYRELWSDRPAAPVAASAELRLLALESASGRELRGASDYRRRGDACFDANRNEAALSAYDEVLRRRDAGARDRARAAAQRAETLFRLRRYADAAQAYAALPPQIEARIGWARSLARSGEPLRGAEELVKIARRERGAAAERARLLAALLYAGEGEAERARDQLAELARRGRSEFARDARWQLAWSDFVAGRDAEAERGFRRLAAGVSDPLEALRARYWQARALERQGAAEGTAQLAAIAREYPLSYYGWRAGLRLAAAGASDAALASDARTLAAGTARLREEDFERAQILLEAGYPEYALAALQGLEGKGRALGDRLQLAQLYAEAGDFHQAQRLIVDAYSEPLARGPEPGALDLWWLAWPAPFADSVRGSAVAESARGLQPELVYAIMREESGYRPAVLSISGARGLLQLMPETARRAAGQIALVEFHDDDLFAPPINIRLGAAYLAELLERFDGRSSAAIASYNAGPEAVTRWLAGNPAEDDIWVEAIPYDQTRAYVKRVLRSLHAYRVLY